MTESPLPTTALGRIFALLGGILFVLSLLYFLVRYHAFAVSAGPWSALGLVAIAIDVGLFSVFALHHSVFARTGMKAIIQSRASVPLERTTYVWIASLLFALTLWAWRPVPGMVWQAEGVVAAILNAGTLAGLLLTLVSAWAIDPLELAGIRQAFGWPARGDRALTTKGAYGLVRHPIYLGWVLLVWSVPVMTGTCFVFALTSTAYLVIAIPFEEREMRRTMGQPYEDYSRKVRSRMLPGIY